MDWQSVGLEEVLSCPVCGSGSRRLEYTFAPFGLMRCERCSAGYLSPRVQEDEMVRVYQDPSYFSSSSHVGYSDYHSQSTGLRRSFRGLLRMLRRWRATDGELLEIGCGPGLFLAESRPFFSRQIGMDFSPSALEDARAYADDVVVGGIEALGETERFDLVVAISLIEHVYDPVIFLRRLVEHLKEDGRVLFVTPDIDGIWHGILGRLWPSFKVPEHVVLYNRRSLRFLGDSCGLEGRFFHFTQFAPLLLVFESLGLEGFLPKSLKGFQLPIPFTMLGVLYQRMDL